MAHLTGRDCDTFKVFDEVSITTGTTLTHTGIEIFDYQEVSFSISSTGNVTVYVQFSDDNVNWYDLKSLDDADRSWNCNAEKIFVTGTVAARYMRLVVYASSDSTVTGVITGRV